VNEFGSNVERHRCQLLVHCYRMLGSLTDAEDAAGDVASCLAVSRQHQGRRAVAPMTLPRGHERLPRKYVRGVVPSIVRNI
jgi:DNA-directed RNA polymerase specialized sigma24 family protein